jgi:hypothetical protein
MKGGSIKGGGFLSDLFTSDYKKYSDLLKFSIEKLKEIAKDKKIHIDILDDKNVTGITPDHQKIINESLIARYSADPKYTKYKDIICNNPQPGNVEPTPAATNAAPPVSMEPARPDMGMRGPPPPAGMNMDMRGPPGPPPPPAGPSMDDDDLLAPPPGGMRGGKGRRRRSSSRSKKSKKVKKGGKTKKTARKGSKKSKKVRKTKVRKSANNSAGVLKRIKNTQNMQMAAAAGYM